MRFDTTRPLILVLALMATAAMGGCARPGGTPPATEEVRQGSAPKPTAVKAYVYVTPALRVSYEGLSLLDDGTVLVFFTYWNLSDTSVFEFPADDAPASAGQLPGSKLLLLSDSGSRYEILDEGELRGPTGQRLLPRSSFRAGFAFRPEGSRSHRFSLWGRREASGRLFHLISSQRVREIGAEGSGETGREWGLSLVVDHMAP